MRKLYVMVAFAFLLAMIPASAEMFTPDTEVPGAMMYKDGVFWFRNGDEVVRYESVAAIGGLYYTMAETEAMYPGFVDDVQIIQLDDTTWEWIHNYKMPVELQTKIESFTLRYLSGDVPDVKGMSYEFDGMKLDFSDLAAQYPVDVRVDSVVVSGVSDKGDVILDPIYQVNYTSNPALLLLNSTLETSPDSSFNYTDITAGVSDSLDSTNYSLSAFKKILYNFDSYQNGAITNCTTQARTRDGTNCEINTDYATNRMANLTSYLPLLNGTNIRIWMKPDTTPFTMYFTDFAQTKIYAAVDTANITHYNWYNVSLSNLSSGTTQIYLHDDGVAGAIKVRFDYIELWSYDASGISAKWNLTFDNAYAWYLVLRSVSSDSGIVRMFAYRNDTHPATKNVSSVMSGVGWWNFNVSDLMEYELDTAGLSYTYLRFWTDTPVKISEILLRKEFNDTIPPSVNDCWLNTTSLMNGQKVRLTCNATDNLAVSGMTGLVNGTEYSFSQDDGLWYYDWQCTNSSVGGFNWRYANATDISGLTGSRLVSLNWTCSDIVCTGFFRECYFSETPLLNSFRRVPVICDLNTPNDISCVISTYSSSGVLLSTSPESSYIDGKGLVNSFISDGGILHGYYSGFMLNQDESYSVRVSCGSDYYEWTIEPEEKGLSGVVSLMIWSRDNLGLVFGVFLFVALLLGAIYTFLKWLRVI